MSSVIVTAEARRGRTAACAGYPPAATNAPDSMTKRTAANTSSPRSVAGAAEGPTRSGEGGSRALPSRGTIRKSAAGRWRSRLVSPSRRIRTPASTATSVLRERAEHQPHEHRRARPGVPRHRHAEQPQQAGDEQIGDHLPLRVRANEHQENQKRHQTADTNTSDANQRLGGTKRQRNREDVPDHHEPHERKDERQLTALGCLASTAAVPAPAPSQRARSAAWRSSGFRVSRGPTWARVRRPASHCSRPTAR